MAEWVDLDLSAAIFFTNSSGVPRGKFDGTGIVSFTGTSTPEFAFAGLELDPAEFYDVEVTYEAATNTSLFVYGLAGTSQADYDTSPVNNFYANESNSGGAVTTFTIGPGINQWDLNVPGFMFPAFQSNRFSRLIGLRILGEGVGPVDPPVIEDITGTPAVAAAMAAGEGRTYSLTSPVSGSLVFWLRDPGATLAVTNLATSTGFADAAIVHGHETVERPGPGRGVTATVSAGDELRVTIAASVAGTHELRWQTLAAGMGIFQSVPSVTETWPLADYPFEDQTAYRIRGHGDSNTSTADAVAEANASLEYGPVSAPTIYVDHNENGLREAELTLLARKLGFISVPDYHTIPTGLPTLPEGIPFDDRWDGVAVMVGGSVSIDPEIPHAGTGLEDEHDGFNTAYTTRMWFGFMSPDYVPPAPGAPAPGAAGAIAARVLNVDISIVNNDVVDISGPTYKDIDWTGVLSGDGFVYLATWPDAMQSGTVQEVPAPTPPNFQNAISASLGSNALIFTVQIQPPPYLNYQYLLDPATPPGTWVRRPLRMHPRSDALGMSSVRRYGITPRSVQASLRRGGGTYI